MCGVRAREESTSFFSMLFTKMGETRRISMLRKGRGGIKSPVSGNLLADHWLGFCAFTAEGLDSIPGWQAKIPQAVRRSQKKKEESYFRFVNLRCPLYMILELREEGGLEIHIWE